MRRTSPSQTVPHRRRSSTAASHRSIENRISSIGNAERGHDEAVASAEEAIHEEIDEIKRYEVGAPCESIIISTI